MLRIRTLSPLLQVALLLVASVIGPARAQQSPQQTVIQVENVRTEYARVLRAQPVYQTLRATAMVEVCEDGVPAADGEEKSRLARVVGAVKDALTPGKDAEEDATTVQPREGCQLVPTEREFQRPIAYDVDYVHHGVKYRSRMPYDPGDRLRVRVSITPIVSGGP
ncbi:hypothetical protein [Luteimonas lutimaris]|uniref:DUF3857 domain-containing protein n=1 Tax=Luteimonas lutimaris TaxID=698645 RepID=A0ABP7MI19_9GAMM|nr:hypothetical protein [Luteimonas sp.]